MITISESTSYSLINTLYIRNISVSEKNSTNNRQITKAQDADIDDKPFVQIDINKDGNIDRNELNIHHLIGKIDSMTGQLIRDKDTDSDNSLSAEELDLDSDTFALIDVNNDGSADRAELNAFYPVSKIDYMTTQMIKNKDSDNDNTLTAEELNMDSGRFSQIDTNNDGKAGRAELNSFYPVSKIDDMTAQLIKDKDSDEDNTLTAQELNVDSDTLSLIDTDGNGSADRAELNLFFPISKTEEIINQYVQNSGESGSDSVQTEGRTTIDVKV